MFKLRRGASMLLATGLFVLSACSSAAKVPAVVCVGASTTYLDWLNGDFKPDTAGTIPQASATAGDLLSAVKARGKLEVSTDPDYAPQSFKNPDNTWGGFDIDVATEVAKRLGVTVEFQSPSWDAITAGSWSNRWDISVGSMTITTPRKEILDFTQPYYYTPAFLAASKDSGITKLDQLPFTLPTGAKATTLPTDANCAEAIQAGRKDFALWISSGSTIDGAIAGGAPLVKIGTPIFTEDLSIAVDKKGLPDASLLYAIDKIIGDMHADGTLTTLSKKAYKGEDLTIAPS